MARDEYYDEYYDEPAENTPGAVDPNQIAEAAATAMQNSYLPVAPQSIHDIYPDGSPSEEMQGPPPPPAVVDLAKAAAAAERPAAPPEPQAPRKDYAAKFDELMANSAEDPRREKLRNQRLPTKDAIAIALGNTGKGKASNITKQVLTARDAKRTSDTAAFDSSRKQKINDYLMKKKMGGMEAASDPASAESVAAQKLMKQIDPDNDYSGMSAEQIAPLQAIGLKIKQAKNKHEETMAKNELTRFYKNAKLTADKEKAYYIKKEKDFGAVNRAIERIAGFKGRGMRARYMNSDRRVALAGDGLRMLAMVSAGEKEGGTKSDPAVEAEVASVFASLITGGNSPGIETIQEFISRTGVRTWAQFKKWFTAKPQDGMGRAMLDHVYHQMKEQYNYWNGLRDNAVQAMSIGLEHVFNHKDYGEAERDRFFRSVEAAHKRHRFIPKSKRIKARIGKKWYWFDAKTRENLGEVEPDLFPEGWESGGTK